MPLFLLCIITILLGHIDPVGAGDYGMGSPLDQQRNRITYRAQTGRKTEVDAACEFPS